MAQYFRRLRWGIGVSFLLPLLTAAADTTPSSNIFLKEALVLRSVSRPGRSAIHLDAVEAVMVRGDWRAPKTGDSVTSASGQEQRWEAATATEPGVLKGSVVRGGYIYWPVTSNRRQVMLLEASGHSLVYVNGEIRTGDPYGNGYLRLPVLLREGTNDFLFQSGRGDLRVKLIASPEPLSINTADSTLPDFIRGETEPVWGAAVLLNATTNFMSASLRVLERGGAEQLVSIPPLGLFKAPFLVRPPKANGTNIVSVTLEAADRTRGNRNRVRTNINLRIRKPDQTYVRTFQSEIDGNVQYYAVNPVAGGTSADERPALFLSLHGAGVEARGQAEAYSPKKWGPIVCPTNRRPYGFDWEEWGRWDALEVLAQALERYHPDPSRVYLTGHSMGGHGTWQLGVLYPDRFAAIGPSAGWISFSSYASRDRSGPTNAIQQILRKAAAASDTLLMATNYLQEGIYILHGDADDNVPVSEAREMRRVLSGFHRDFDFHEQPGAGHWWDASDEPGTDCVDWSPMFDFFARHVIPSDESLRRVRFVTVNPAGSAKSHWVTIVAQEHQLEPSAIDLRCDPGKRRIVGSTTNVSRLRLEFPSINPGPGLTIELDGQELEGVVLAKPMQPETGTKRVGKVRVVPELNLVRESGRWTVGAPAAASVKQPQRSGPFRQAFRNHVLLVYGTQGTPEENAWTLTKARYDAETFYYRGNGSLELMADVDLVSQEKQRADRQRKPAGARNVILYGHADCNAAWAFLLARSPVQIRRGQIAVADHHFSGTDLGCLFLQPNPRDEEALVGVVGGTGLAGLRVTERLPYFMSGAGFPDCLVIGAELPDKGINGIRGAGFFGPDWQVGSGEFAWGE